MIVHKYIQICLCGFVSAYGFLEYEDQRDAEVSTSFTYQAVYNICQLVTYQC